MSRILLVVVIGIFFFVACGGDTGNPGGVETLTDCESAFKMAAEVSDLEDTVEDLDPAVRSCDTIEEWNSASAKYPAALDGVDPETFLGNRCLYGNFSSDGLCGQIE